MKKIIKKILENFGFKVSRLPDLDIKRRILLIRGNNINKIIDVGANSGQYASTIRRFGFKEDIISFEPLGKSFQDLKKNAEKDHKWQVFNYAIGDKDEDGVINISKNSISSSINKMKISHLNASPDSGYIGKEKIKIKRLDSLFKNFYVDGDKIMLKIDTQGFEKKVIDGAKESLSDIVLIQLEMSLIALYENELLLKDMLQYLWKKGFQLVSIENGFYDNKTGQLLQVDGIFINKNKNNN